MIPNGFKPLLAGTLKDFIKLKYPVFVSPKLDGIRCTVFDGVAYSRTLKKIPNRCIQDWCMQNRYFLEGFDGELIVGDVTSKDVFQKSTSGVMSVEGTPDFAFWVFDYVDSMSAISTFKSRVSRLRTKFDEGLKTVKVPEKVGLVPQTFVGTEKFLLEIENDFVAQGFEGLMVKSPEGRYKYGRSTEKEQILLKVKRWTDKEFKVIGFEQKMHNANEAKLDSLGRTERSSHKANLVPLDTLGALVLEFHDTKFSVGTGFDDKTRKEIWENMDEYLGKFAKVKFFEVGMKDLPRFPVFLGFRSELDFDKEV